MSYFFPLYSDGFATRATAYNYLQVSFKPQILTGHVSKRECRFKY